MTESLLLSRPVERSTTSLRLAVIGRRVFASEAVAGVLVGLVYGDRTRDHVETLHLATGTRGADAMEART